MEHLNLIAKYPRESGDNRSLQGSGEGDMLHHLPLGIKVGVEVARFCIGDVEVQCQRQWIVLCLQPQHELML